jgi:hypothetical protein
MPGRSNLFSITAELGVLNAMKCNRLLLFSTVLLGSSISQNGTGASTTPCAVPMPNFIKHNQAAPPCSSSTPAVCPSPSPCSGSCPKTATICVNTDNATSASYCITDQWGLKGSTHDRNNLSSENCGSTLFTTTFVAGSLTVSPAPAGGSNNGEVIISGEDSNKHNQMVSWVSSQNGCPDDDVTWIQR